MTPNIMFQTINLATSIILTTFHVYFNLEFLPPTSASNPFVPQDISSILQIA